MVLWGQHLTVLFLEKSLPLAGYRHHAHTEQDKGIFSCCSSQLFPEYLESRDTTEATLGWHTKLSPCAIEAAPGRALPPPTLCF